MTLAHYSIGFETRPGWVLSQPNFVMLNKLTGLKLKRVSLIIYPINVIFAQIRILKYPNTTVHHPPPIPTLPAATTPPHHQSAPFSHEMIS
jgi:hypothetical protein